MAEKLAIELKVPGEVSIVLGARKVAVYEPISNVVYTDLYEGDRRISRVLKYISETFQVPRDHLSIESSSRHRRSRG